MYADLLISLSLPPCTFPMIMESVRIRKCWCKQQCRNQNLPQHDVFRVQQLLTYIVTFDSHLKLIIAMIKWHSSPHFLHFSLSWKSVKRLYSARVQVSHFCFFVCLCLFLLKCRCKKAQTWYTCTDTIAYYVYAIKFTETVCLFSLHCVCIFLS